MIDWKKIDTVLLDMDGTLLDLNFDNHFWKEFVPLKYAEQKGISTVSAKQQLEPQFKSMEGKLEWYCLDYWSQCFTTGYCRIKSGNFRINCGTAACHRISGKTSAIITKGSVSYQCTPRQFGVKNGKNLFAAVFR